MKTFSRIIKSVFAVGLLVASSVSFAIPTLNFGGSINYSTSSDILSIAGVITPGSTDLSYDPVLATSSVILSADFTSSSSDGSYTTGLFGTTPANDLFIADAFGTNTLLTGDISTLTLTGREGGTLGILAGVISITGGLLAGDFGGVGSLFAINFNLDTFFDPSMFNGDFFGISNGSITRVDVPEPMPLALLSLGLIGITLTRKVCKR